MSMTSQPKRRRLLPDAWLALCAALEQAHDCGAVQPPARAPAPAVEPDAETMRAPRMVKVRAAARATLGVGRELQGRPRQPVVAPAASPTAQLPAGTHPQGPTSCTPAGAPQVPHPLLATEVQPLPPSSWGAWGMGSFGSRSTLGCA